MENNVHNTLSPVSVTWSPEGAVRTAVRRMTKKGKSLPAIINILKLAACNQTAAKGNIGGAIKRMRKHGITDRAIYTAIATVAVTLGAEGHANVTVKAGKATREVLTKARKDSRTPEQVQADKERMAKVRSCRKTHVKKVPEAIVDTPNGDGHPDLHGTDAMEAALATKLFEGLDRVPHPEDLAASHGNVAPTLKQPIVLNSFDELDALLDDMGIAH